MTSIKICQPLIGLALALLLLAGCGTPDASPTPPLDLSQAATDTLPPSTATPEMRATEAALPAGCPPGCAGATLYRADLAGQDLSGVDLSGAYLRLADLRGTNLEGANLRLAQLDGANLAGADLRGASLQGAQLRAALQDGPVCPGAEGPGAGSSGANTCVANLAGADLSRADLRDAALNEADLAGAVLREADAQGADFRGAILRQADLAGATLRGADLRRADLSGADLAGADLGGADLREAVVSEEQLGQVLADRDGVRPGPPVDCTLHQPPGLWDPIWAIEIAPDRSVWLAGSQGVARLDLRSGVWTSYSLEDGLPGDQVRSITAEADGSVWLALRQAGGVAHFDGESWRHYPATDEGLISNEVHEVTIAPDGSVWFATADGASRWDRETDTWTRYTEEDGLLANQVWRVLFTRDGKVWFAHLVGMTVLELAETEEEEDVWASYGTSSFLASTEAKVDGSGRMWLGQAYYDPFQEEWVDTVYREFEVQDLAADKWGGLWIGRRDGAYYIPDPRSSPREEWQYYGSEQGLPDDNVLVIEMETDGIVWFGTAAGAARCVVEPGQGLEGTRAPEVTLTPAR
jgi:uncharacterized protein YjbI with pentapeptide repeats/frataxin-like iron-binding protein CyaY